MVKKFIDKSFICEYCGSLIVDSPEKFISGCEHYPLPKEDLVNTTKGFSTKIEINISNNSN